MQKLPEGNSAVSLWGFTVKVLVWGRGDLGYVCVDGRGVLGADLGGRSWLIWVLYG